MSAIIVAVNVTVAVDNQYKNDKCTEVSPASPIWNIKLIGCSENHLKGDIQIELLGISSSKQESCIGFSPDNNEVSNTQRWSCLTGSKDEKTGSGVSKYSSKTNHFT